MDPAVGERCRPLPDCLMGVASHEGRMDAAGSKVCTSFRHLHFVICFFGLKRVRRSVKLIAFFRPWRCLPTPSRKAACGLNRRRRVRAVLRKSTGDQAGDGTKCRTKGEKESMQCRAAQDDRLLFPRGRVPKPIVGRPREDEKNRADERKMREADGARAARRN